MPQEPPTSVSTPPTAPAELSSSGPKSSGSPRTPRLPDSSQPRTPTPRSPATPASKAAPAASPVTSLLPSTKLKTGLDPSTSKGLLYGPPKIGKTTLLAGLDPDHTLFLACEPGLGGLEVFQVPVPNWETFLKTCAELATTPHPYKLIVVDTADQLVRMCSEYVLAKLGVEHPSDAAYGKGWDAVNNEFRMKISKLANMGLGIWFISHSQEKEIDARVGKITKTVPTLSGRSREFVIGFVDVILLAESQTTDQGERRVLRTSKTETYEAGIRGGVLPDPLPLDPVALREALVEAWS
jgi:hypothetical protein